MDSQPRSVGLVWGSAAIWRWSAYVRWTGWTLAVTESWWQHHKHCLLYYYYYYSEYEYTPDAGNDLAEWRQMHLQRGMNMTDAPVSSSSTIWLANSDIEMRIYRGWCHKNSFYNWCRYFEAGCPSCCQVVLKTSSWSHPFCHKSISVVSNVVCVWCLLRRRIDRGRRIEAHSVTAGDVRCRQRTRHSTERAGSSRRGMAKTAQSGVGKVLFDYYYYYYYYLVPLLLFFCAR